MLELLQRLQSHPPFSFLDAEAFEILDEASSVGYYANNTVLVDEKQYFEVLFVIIKGIVESYNEDELIDIYHDQDIFGGIEHLKNEPSSYKYVVREELICYEIPKTVFLQLCNKYHSFRDYFVSSLVQRINLFQEKQEYASMSDLMTARVDRNLLHKACIVEPSTPIKIAIKQMEDANTNALIVKNKNEYGIVTDTNLRKYILREEFLEVINEIQTKPIISIKEDELLFNVLLLMTQRSIKHLPVFDDSDNLVGLLELIDVVSFFSSQTHLITAQIDNATNLESLVAACKRVPVMISALQSKGAKSRYIAKLVAGINKKMYAKIFEFIFPEEWKEHCVLILLGSEGREEQILRTDQDNAIIFEDGFYPNNIEKITLSFIEVLDAIGFPRCEGNIMVTNPKWQQNFFDYKKMIDDWMEHPSPESMIDMAIFFDSIPVAGKLELHSDLRDYFINLVETHTLLIRHFAKSIESFDEALGIFSQFTTQKGHKNEIDIKKAALFLIVHGVRSLALEFKITATNTFDRLKELNNNGFLSREDAHALIESLEFINTIRLDSQLKQYQSGLRVTNYVSLTNIGKFKRDLLKEVLKTVSRFKKIVSYHFHLSMVS
ncbi:MAG: putative nucleotidyltransferase substrate binding domain-containing protein [Sulfurovaceae bacterium]|nr:putative nucleotidyltransferase substrate binding domain-containing protein [Sulfurovaceae bacterium]